MKLSEKPIRTFYNRFSIDKLTKYTKRTVRSLPELISRYPGYGDKFKVFHTLWKNKFYTIEDIQYKDNRHCKILGIKFYKENPISKVIKLRNTLKKGLWMYTIPDIECKTDNNINYNICRIKQLVESKKNLLKERNQLLGIVNLMKIKAAEQKKKKKEDKLKKKK